MCYNIADFKGYRVIMSDKRLTNYLNYFSQIDDIEKRLDEFCESIENSEEKAVMRRRNELIMAMINTVICSSEMLSSSFFEYYEKNGFNPFSLFVIALGLKMCLQPKVGYYEEYLNFSVFSYFHQLLHEASLGEFSFLDHFFFTKDFDELIMSIVKPVVERRGSFRDMPISFYSYPFYLWECLKKIYFMLSSPNQLVYYGKTLTKLLLGRINLLNFYSYINKIDNIKLRKAVFNWFKYLALNYVNIKNLDSKYFSHFVSNVFRVDSFTELVSKFKFIEYMLCLASKTKKPNQLMEQVCLMLDNDVLFKERYNNELVTNDISWKIIDKMKNIYKRIDDRIAYYFLDEVLENAKGLNALDLGAWLKDDEYNCYYDNYYKKIEKIVEDEYSYINNNKISGSGIIIRKDLILRNFKELGMNKEFREFFTSYYDKNKDNISFTNLYIIALAFLYQRDNLNNFKAILEDSNVYINSSYTDFTKEYDFDLYLFYLLSMVNYKSASNLRCVFRMFVEEFDGNVSDLDKKVIDEDGYISEEELEELIGEKNKFFFEAISGNERNRINFITDNLLLIEDNELIRKDIFEKIENLSVRFFKEVDNSNKSDFFIECMKIVFDSDTYIEMNNKLNLLKEASLVYEEGNKEKALEIVKGIGDISHKEVLNDRVVGYPSGSINMIIKPKKIIERMKELYPKFDDSISYEFLDDVHSNANNYSDILDVTERKRNSLIGRIKQKLMLMRK